MKKNRILIVNHHGIGDNIMMTPSIRALKRSQPDVEIYLLVSGEYEAIKDLWSTNPYVANTFVSKIPFHPRFWNPVIFYLKDYPLIRKEAYKLAREVKASKVFIVRQQYFPEFLEKRIPFLPKHRVDRIAYELKVELKDYYYDIFPQEQHYKRAQLFLNKYHLEDEHLIGLHTMPSNAGPRTWKLKHVKVLTEYLHSEYGYKFIHFHSKKSYYLEKSLESTSLDSRYVHSTYQENGEELDILTVAVLAKKCELVIAIDSAIAYIANAVNTPLILLCNPKNPYKERIPKQGIVFGIDKEDFLPDDILSKTVEVLNKLRKT